MDSNTATESNLSLRSRSLLNRVNDRLREMLDHLLEDAMQDIDKRSMIWRMFMSSTLEASVFMGKNCSDNLHAIKNAGKVLTMKQMFGMSEKLMVGRTDEIYGVNTINWDDSPGKHMSLIGDEEVINQSHACEGSCTCRCCVMPWKDERGPTIKCCLGRTVQLDQRFTTIQNFGHN